MKLPSRLMLMKLFTNESKGNGPKTYASFEVMDFALVRSTIGRPPKIDTCRVRGAPSPPFAALRFFGEEAKGGDVFCSTVNVRSENGTVSALSRHGSILSATRQNGLPKLSTNRHRMKMLGIAPPDIAKIKEAP